MRARVTVRWLLGELPVSQVVCHGCADVCVSVRAHNCGILHKLAGAGRRTRVIQCRGEARWSRGRSRRGSPWRALR